MRPIVVATSESQPEGRGHGPPPRTPGANLTAAEIERQAAEQDSLGGSAAGRRAMTQATAPIRDGLDPSKLRFVEVDGIRTRYYEDGEGETLVLFHGGDPGSLYSLDSWSLNLAALAGRFHVVAVDKLGMGYTDNPRTPLDYAPGAVLAHAQGFLDALAIDRAHLVGHSRGGSLI